MKSAQLTDQAFLQIALDLSTSLPRGQINQRLIDASVKAFPCDAAALLILQGDYLVPVAQHGLAPEILGLKFLPQEHPRFQAILAQKEPVRFAASSELPDPFDGLIAADLERELDVHACMGCSLYVEETLVGALVLDALAVGAFDKVSDIRVAMFSALAAAQLRNAALLKKISLARIQQQAVSQELVIEARQREGELTGQSKTIEALRSEITMVAESELAVLITGETGTGKELVARTIHAQSKRANQPLVHVNCAALPTSLAESELFGHIKGAFTGAVADRMGKFELANQGTLLLDELGELSLDLQAKLLRALQQGEIQRVGSDKLLHVDVRIIAATNRNLELEVEQGRFRRDLYHRLCVFPIQVPPLRERKEDLPILCGQFLQQAQHRLGCAMVSLHPKALDSIADYDWPGNVRELEHLLLRAALKAKGDNQQRVLIEQHHLELNGEEGGYRYQPEPFAQRKLTQLAPHGLRQATEDFQRGLIRQAQEENNGVWARSAVDLQLDRGNLYRLAKRLGV